MSKPKPTQKLCFKIDVKPMNGGMKITQDIQGYNAYEVLGIIELIKIDVLNNINKPAARDKGDDML